MPRLVLVRHCESAVDPGSPPATWGLTGRGAQQARSLVKLTTDPVVVAAGDEPKMVQSLDPLADAAGVEVRATPELRESHSEGWFADEAFLDVVRRFFDQPSSSPAPGWEAADAAADRFVGELHTLTAGLPDEATVVVCSGGRVLTAALHRMGLVRPDDRYAVWRAIRMPDVAEVVVQGRQASLHSPFGSRSLALD